MNIQTITYVIEDDVTINIQNEPFVRNMTPVILRKDGVFNGWKGILIKKFLHKAEFYDLEWCKDSNWFMTFDIMKEEWVINIREAYLDHLRGTRKITNFDEEKLMCFLLKNCDKFSVGIENPITKLSYRRSTNAVSFTLNDAIYEVINTSVGGPSPVTYKEPARLINNIYNYVNTGDLIKTDKPFLVFISGWDKPLKIGYMNDELRDYISWKIVLDGPNDERPDTIYDTFIKNIPTDYVIYHLNEKIMTYQDDSINTKVARLLNIDKNGQELNTIMEDIPGRNRISAAYLMVFRYLYKQLGINYTKLDNNLLFMINKDTGILLLDYGIIIDSYMNPCRDAVYKLSYIHLRRAIKTDIYDNWPIKLDLNMDLMAAIVDQYNGNLEENYITTEVETMSKPGKKGEITAVMSSTPVIDLSAKEEQLTSTITMIVPPNELEEFGKWVENNDEYVNTTLSIKDPDIVNMLIGALEASKTLGDAIVYVINSSKEYLDEDYEWYDLRDEIYTVYAKFRVEKGNYVMPPYNTYRLGSAFNIDEVNSMIESITTHSPISHNKTFYNILIASQLNRSCDIVIITGNEGDTITNDNSRMETHGHYGIINSDKIREDEKNYAIYITDADKNTIITIGIGVLSTTYQNGYITITEMAHTEVNMKKDELEAAYSFIGQKLYDTIFDIK